VNPTEETNDKKPEAQYIYAFDHLVNLKQKLEHPID
jgi:hypothetical protein